MGYKNAGIYQAYINKWIQYNVQAAFLRHSFADALFKSLIYVGWDINLWASQSVIDLTNNSLKTHPLIVKLCQWHNALSKAIKELYKTLKIA